MEAQTEIVHSVKNCLRERFFDYQNFTEWLIKLESHEVQENYKKVVLLCLERIDKFSDVPHLFNNEYCFLLLKNRPYPSFILENIELKELVVELKKYLEVEDIFEYVSQQDKDYRKKFMPNLNLTLIGRRNAPPLNQIIDILGKTEVSQRITIEIDYLSSILAL